MQTEPLTGARKPEQTDGPLGGLQISNAVDDLAPLVLPYFTTNSNRDAAFTDWVTAGHTMRDGLQCWLAGSGRQEYTTAGGWTTVSDGKQPGKRQRQWYVGRTGNASDTSSVNGTPVLLMAATITSAPAGDYQIACREVISGTVAGPGFQSLTVNDVDVAPSSGTADPRADLMLAGQRHVFVQTAGYTHAGGNLTVKALYQSSTGGSFTVWSQGTEISVFYLGPS